MSEGKQDTGLLKPPALLLKGLRKRIGPVRIFTGLDLSLAKGEILAVLGPRKSGKTHLLRAAAGLMPVNSGKIEFSGKRAGFMPPPFEHGVQGDPGMFPRTTVEEHLEFLAACARVPRARRRAMIQDVLSLMELSDLAGKTATGLTRHQKARLLFAGALIGDPEVLLLDDPLPSFYDDLDVFWAVCRELAKMGKAIMLTASEPRMLESGPDRVAVLYGGRIAFACERDQALTKVASAGWPPPPAIFGGIEVYRPPPMRIPPKAAPALAEHAPMTESPAKSALMPPDAEAEVVKRAGTGQAERATGAPAPGARGSHLKNLLQAFASRATRLPGPLFWNDVRMNIARGRAFPWVSGGLAGLCALILLGTLPDMVGSAQLHENAPGKALFLTFSVILMSAVALLAPAFSAVSFIAEKNRRTFDLLASSGLSSLEIVWGKFLYSMTATIVACIACVPPLFLAFSLGGVHSTQLIKHAILYATTAAAVCSMGIGLSLLLRSGLLSVFLCYSLSVFLFIASVIATLIIRAVNGSFDFFPYPGFWVIASVLNAAMAVFVLLGATVAFRAMTRWDY